MMMFKQIMKCEWRFSYFDWHTFFSLSSVCFNCMQTNAILKCISNIVWLFLSLARSLCLSASYRLLLLLIRFAKSLFIGLPIIISNHIQKESRLRCRKQHHITLKFWSTHTMSQLNVNCKHEPYKSTNTCKCHTKKQPFSLHRHASFSHTTVCDNNKTKTNIYASHENVLASAYECVCVCGCVRACVVTECE